MRPRHIASIAAASMLLLTPARADEQAFSLRPIRDSDWNRDLAAHLLGRAGFGATPDTIVHFVELGVDGAVDALVDYDKIPFEFPPPDIPAELHTRVDRSRFRELSEERRRELRQQRRELERDAFVELRLWWLERMVVSPRPLEEKMTLFWHGHFTSGMREVRRATFMHEQNEFFRRNALGNFRELLLGISRDRAMLIYLDGHKNNKRKPNENYARELLELFSLGEGNYAEADVKAAARAFTGWTFDEFGFVFDQRNHDSGPKRFLGRTGNLDGEDIINIILQQQACSEYLARNLLEYFVRPEPHRRAVNRLAAEIRKRKFELKPVLQTLFKSEMFYHQESRGGLVKSPVELLVGTARRLGTPIFALESAQRALIGMGQELFQPPNVKGWDGGEAWINTATLFTRYNTVGALVNGIGRRPRDAAEMQAMTVAFRAGNDVADDANDEVMRMMSRRSDTSRRGTRYQPEFDPEPWLRRYGLQSADQIVDFFARQMLAVPLPAEKQAALVKYLDGDDGRFDLGAKKTDDRLRMMLHLLCSTPEYQMY